jgi:hypothetical protein
MHLPLNQYRNSEQETERPAQDQQYKQVSIRLRGNRKPCHVGHEKSHKTKGKSGYCWGVSRRNSHNLPEIPKKQNCNPSDHK